MESFFEFLKTTVIVLGIAVVVIVVVVIILLSLPSSKLRGVVLQIVGIINSSVAVISVLYIINPADLIPDIIPLLGQIDDGVAVINAIFTGIIGIGSIAIGNKDQKKFKILKSNDNEEKIENL